MSARERMKQTGNNLDFSDIERSIVDYLESAGAAVEYRDYEWLLIQGEAEISLTALAAVIHSRGHGQHPSEQKRTKL
jgi:hypothetical protein